MKSIKQKVEDDIKTIGKNHLNSKILELLDLGVELAEKDIETLSSTLDTIRERVSIYQDIIKERY